MSAIDTDFGFDAVFRKSATELKRRLAKDAMAPSAPLSGRQRGTVTAPVIFTGLGLLSLGIFAIGYSALQSDAPEIWIHRLMALAIAQSILIGAVTMKLLPILKRERLPFALGISGLQLKSIELTRRAAPLRFETLPPPLPEPPKPVTGGQLAGRDFLEYHDGSVEIDTLVGRRRFVSLEAAREFVGS
jgi:hypothetical protein